MHWYSCEFLQINQTEIKVQWEKIWWSWNPGSKMQWAKCWAMIKTDAVEKWKLLPARDETWWLRRAGYIVGLIRTSAYFFLFSLSSMEVNLCASPSLVSSVNFPFPSFSQSGNPARASAALLAAFLPFSRYSWHWSCFPMRLALDTFRNPVKDFMNFIISSDVINLFIIVQPKFKYESKLKLTLIISCGISCIRYLKTKFLIIWI